MLESLKSTAFSYEKLSAEEQQKRGILGRLVGIMADSKNPTRNGRLYNEELWDKTFENPIMKEKIENRCCFGELGHPEDRTEIDMEKIAICLAEYPKKDSNGKLQAIFDILDTPNGRILKTLCDYGCNIGISSRGQGDVYPDANGNELVDPDTYECECWDAVLIPAVKEARLKYVTESLNKKTLSQALNESLNSASTDDKVIMKETIENLNKILYNNINDSEIENTSSEDIDEVNTDDYLDIGSDYNQYKQNLVNDEKTITHSYDLNERSSIHQFLADFSDLINFIDIDQTGLLYQDLLLSCRDKINNLLNQMSTGSTPDDIDSSSSEDKADNSGLVTIEQLQEMLRANKDLKREVKSLNEKLSVCYTKENQYKTLVQKQYDAIDKLNRSNKSLVTKHEQDNRKIVEKYNIQLDQNSLAMKNEKKALNEKFEQQTMELNSTIKSCKSQIINLKESIEKKEAEIKQSNDVISQLNEKLKESNSRITTLMENSSVDSSKATKIAKQLKEKLQKSELVVSRLNEQVQSYVEQSKDYESKINDLQNENSSLLKKLDESISNEQHRTDSRIEKLNEDLVNAREDLQLKQKDYSQKLENQKKLTEKYKSMASTAVDRYIQTKAVQIGTSADYIKSKLNENYSFKDIDEVCDELRAYQVNVSKLPFNVGKNAKINFNEGLKPGKTYINEDDIIDDQLLRIADLD